MARSIPFSPGIADSYAAPSPPSQISAHHRPLPGRIMDWLMKSQQRRADRQIAQYLKNYGAQRISDSLERDIECRFLARQHERF